MIFFVVYVIESARDTKIFTKCNIFRHLKYLLIRSKEVKQMYSVQEVSMMIKTPYSTIKMWFVFCKRKMHVFATEDLTAPDLHFCC